LLIVPLETLLPFTTIIDAAAHVRTGIAEALLIAVFLAVTVDSYVKRRLINDIALDVSSFMMVSELPATLRQEFHELTRIHLYRTIDIFYKIQRVTGENQVILTGEANFTLYNVRGENEPFRHYIAVQKPFREIPGFKSINNMSAKGVLNPDGHVGDYDEDATANDLGATAMSGTHVECFKDVLIPKKGQADFYAKTTQILPEEHEETYVSVMPAVHTIVRVDYPADMTVTVHFGHRLRTQVSVTPKGRPTQWTLDSAMLPYQPIIIEWRKTKPPPKLLTGRIDAGAAAAADAQAGEPKAS
jgi:hypothetical protein